MRQGQDLLGNSDGMTRERLGDGCAEHDALGARSRGCEDADAVSTAGAAAGHPGRGDAAVFQVFHRFQGGAAVACGYHRADSLLNHIVTIKLKLTPGMLPFVESVGAASISVNKRSFRGGMLDAEAEFHLNGVLS